MSLHLRADVVTWPRCRGPDDWRRILRSPQDNNATKLDLDACDIQQLTHKHLNVDLPKLNSISLSYNDIKYIDPSVFKPVSHIKSFTVVGNKIRKMPVFGVNSLFPRLLTLNLENNEITEIRDVRTFSACVRLKYLNLQRNHIEYVHPDVFKPLIKLRKLDLQNNNITYISDSFQIRSLKYAFLSHNLIDYVAPSVFLGSKLRDLRLNNNRLTFLPVNMTSEMMSAGAKLYRFLFHENPWQCACLIEHLADVQKFERILYMDGRYLYRNILSVCENRGQTCQRETPASLEASSQPTDSGLQQT